MFAHRTSSTFECFLRGDLRQRLRQVNERIRNEVTRRRHRVASTRLLQSVLSPQGVVYPRVRFQESTEGLLRGE